MVQEFRTPDVYFERAPKADRGQRLEKVRIDVAGFLGFASRGPVGMPMRIQNWKSFEDIFGGFSPDCFLPQSVFGFFANGGDACYIVRVAKLSGDDAASSSSLKLRDLYGRPTLAVTARDPGTWGNKLKVRVVAASKPARTSVRADIAPGAGEVDVDVTKGFEPRAAVKVSDGEKTEYAVVERVERKKLVLEDELKTAFEAERTTIESIEVQVQVTSRDQFEIHDNLVLAPGHSRSLVERINTASRLIKVDDLRSLTPSPFNLPSLEVEEMLAGGRDGTGGATAEDFIGWDRGPNDRCGVHAFEEVDEIGLICAPDVTSLPGAATKNAEKPPALQKVQVLRPHGVRDEREVEAIQQALVDFCERKKTLFALLDPPPHLDADQVLDWRSRFDTRYAACYWPWLRVLDPLSRSVKVIPPSGHMAGLYARSDREQGVHKAPANDTLNDVIGLDREVSKDVTDHLAPEGVNCIRALRGRGIRPWGARTLSSDTQWEHLNVRRLFIMVERSIAEGTEWSVFENNDWYLWKAVEREVSRFLTGIWKEGMLLGSVPEQAFYVRCDETTNPPEARNVGELVCDIGIAAVRPAEFIVFRIGQRTQDIITEEPVKLMAKKSEEADDFFVGGYFTVEIDGINAAAFRAADGLTVHREVVKYQEGGENAKTHKLVGQTRWSNIVLRSGVTGDDDFFKWVKAAVDGDVQRKNGAIIYFDRTQTPKLRWDFTNGWPARWEGPRLDSLEGDIKIEILEIAHDGFEMKKSGSASEGGKK